MWKLARHRIAVKNICFIKEVAASRPKEETRVTWRLEGAWNKAPGATVSVYLQQTDPDADKPKDVARLAEAIPCHSRTALVDLSDYRGKHYRIILRKDGDSETGGHSETFEIK